MSVTERRSGAQNTPVDDGERELADWPVQAAGSIVDLVDKVRDRTTGRAVTVARGIVFGLLMTVLAVIAGVTGLILMVRATQVTLTWAVDQAGGELPHHRAVWISYVAVGSVFTILGAFVWRAANRQAVDPPPA